jgi:hypothetical protein
MTKSLLSDLTAPACFISDFHQIFLLNTERWRPANASPFDNKKITL